MQLVKSRQGGPVSSLWRGRVQGAWALALLAAGRLVNKGPWALQAHSRIQGGLSR